MKLRLKGNTLRLRLDRGDLAHFAEEGRVEAVTWFGDDSAFRYVLQATPEVEDLTAQVESGQIVVRLPVELAEEWAQSERVSLGAEQAVGERQSLRILVEKDLGCQHREAGEEKMFDHLRSGQEARPAG